MSRSFSFSNDSCRVIAAAICFLDSSCLPSSAFCNETVSTFKLFRSISRRFNPSSSFAFSIFSCSKASIFAEAISNFFFRLEKCSSFSIASFSNCEILESFCSNCCSKLVFGVFRYSANKIKPITIQARMINSIINKLTLS